MTFNIKDDLEAASHGSAKESGSVLVKIHLVNKPIVIFAMVQFATIAAWGNLG